MPRQPRLQMPGYPLHVTQRGVNRCAIFIDHADRDHYRQLACETMAKHDIAVHAYVLMDNHVHMLVTPREPASLSAAMRRLGQCHTQAFNRRHHRCGTLWQGRFKSCLVDTDYYLMTVYRYIELNPVRASMVERPELYRWSSVHANLNQLEDPLVSPHPLFLELGTTPATRASVYRDWLHQGTSRDDLRHIRMHIQQERVLGSIAFQSMVEKALGRPAQAKRRGRPRLTIVR